MFVCSSDAGTPLLHHRLTYSYSPYRKFTTYKQEHNTTIPCIATHIDTNSVFTIQHESVTTVNAPLAGPLSPRLR